MYYKTNCFKPVVSKINLNQFLYFNQSKLNFYWLKHRVKFPANSSHLIRYTFLKLLLWTINDINYLYVLMIKADSSELPQSKSYTFYLDYLQHFEKQK